MANFRISRRINQYVLNGTLRQEGFERWRYVFSAVGRTSGQEKKCFVELYIVNPGLSPKSIVIGQKFQPKISESDLQYMFSGSDSALSAQNDAAAVPSYVLVKAGCFGRGGKQLNTFVPSQQFTFIRNSETFKAGDCLFGADCLSGSILVSAQELRARPELMCNSGAIDWNLKYKSVITSKPLYNRKKSFFIPLGVKSLFSGSIRIDGEEFVVQPQKSDGYIDKSWGERPNSSYFHLSSSRITSVITGKPLLNSCFAVEGEFDGSLRAVLDFEGKYYYLARNSFFRRDCIIHDCSQMPESNDGEKVHWSVSIHKGKIVVDIDVYCRIDEMFVRDYEMPAGKKSVLKILGGGTGKGEIRIYKKIGRNLEILEHGTIYDAVCEFGQVEKSENA